MNFLQLVQRTHTECGISGRPPGSVAGQSGLNLRLVQWVADAWEDLQREHEEWAFRWGRQPITFQAGVSHYTPADLGLQAGDRILHLYRDGQPLPVLEWEASRLIGLRGRLDGQPPGQLATLVRQPDGRFLVYPTPDVDQTLDSEYRRAVSVLTDNLDTPSMPADYHLFLVWEAVLQFAIDHADDDLRQRASHKAERLWHKLASDQLPDLELGATFLSQ